MKTRLLTIIGFGILAITGFSLNFDYYQNIISPVNASIEHLDGIISATGEHESIQSHLTEINLNLSQVMEKLPETTDTNGNVVSKNPVWLLPTESTNFLRIQNNVDAMIEIVEEMSYAPKDTSSYYTGMLDLNERSNILKENLLDARGFMYASATSVFFTLIWLSGITGLIRTWMKNEN